MRPSLPFLHHSTTPLLLALQPAHARILFLQDRFEFWIRVRLERGPVERRFEPLALRRAKPEFHRQPAFANVRVLFERETFVQFHLYFGRIRFAVRVTRAVGVEQFEFSAVGPADRRRRQFVEPGELFLGQMFP